MKVAKQIAKRSLCDRDRVGAVIASETNRIVAVGYNNPPAKFEHQGKNCLAWCPRAKDMQTVIGWETDHDQRDVQYIGEITCKSDGIYIPWTYTDSWGHSFDGERKIEDDEMDEFMRSCGMKPLYGTGNKPCPSLHAEANALSVCDRSQREGGTIYVTSVPCYDCAKLITNSGLSKIVYKITDQGMKRMETGTAADGLLLLQRCAMDVVVV